MADQNEVEVIIEKIKGWEDYLLDFANLETGKVVPGAAMWEIAKDFQRLGLMTRGLIAEITPLGMVVAKRIHEQSVHTT